MQKIVINKCFGGFGLSTEAFEHYLKLKGIQYETREPRHKFCKNDKEFYKTDIHKGCNNFLSDRDVSRDDPALIQTVEELGDKAHGWAANLAIVEIPDDVEWQIEEYDGNEWVAEKHRTWG